MDTLFQVAGVGIFMGATFAIALTALAVALRR